MTADDVLRPPSRGSDPGSREHQRRARDADAREREAAQRTRSAERLAQRVNKARPAPEPAPAPKAAQSPPSAPQSAPPAPAKPSGPRVIPLRRSKAKPEEPPTFSPEDVEALARLLARAPHRQPGQHGGARQTFALDRRADR